LPQTAPAKDELSRRMSLASPGEPSPERGIISVEAMNTAGGGLIEAQISSDLDRGLPQIGAVLGIDVGFSTTRRSSAACLLDWSAEHIDWKIQRFRALPADQESSIAGVAGSFLLEAAAFDGPLRAGLDVIRSYRVADRMLTRRLGPRIGKPGQTNAPVGVKLNTAANDLARLVLRRCRLKPTRHATGIDSRAIAEAFPNSFLGVMLEDPSSVPARRDDRSDTFFAHLAAEGTLQRLLHYLLPDRTLSLSLESVRNHDDRAALVCAITALGVAAGDFTAVGDSNGWIILPPRSFIQDWAWSELEINARTEVPGSLYSSEPSQ
jgi:hypothetical protein